MLPSFLHDLEKEEMSLWLCFTLFSVRSPVCCNLGFLGIQRVTGENTAIGEAVAPNQRKHSERATFNLVKMTAFCFGYSIDKAVFNARFTNSWKMCLANSSVLTAARYVLQPPGKQTDTETLMKERTRRHG